MPFHCIVPHCTSRSGNPGISFYRLPLNNPALLKQWLLNIRRENTPINQNSRVCSLHFKDGKKTGKSDVPVIFSWTKKPRKSPKKQTIPCSETPQSSVSVQALIHEVISKHTLDEDNCDEMLTDLLPCDNVCDVSEQATVTDASTNTDPVPKPVSLSDVGIQSVVMMVHDDVQTDEIETKDVEIQATVTTEEASTDINTKLLNDKNVSTSTDDLGAPLTHFCVEAVKDDDKAIRFYTGFSSYMYMMICFNFLGPAVAALSYHEKNSGKETSFMGRHRSLTPLNEFFLTLCRLRVGLKEQDLAYRFGISQSTVSRIITTWLDFMFHKFKEIPIWPNRQVVDQFMPDCFRSLYPRTRCVIDATEVFIEMPSNPTAQQLTFSNYKNHNTLKALVGITPSGAVCFVSDLYGGNISDKKLTVECGILKLFECGDSIMADRGFTIEDILPLGVSLNVPPRMNESGQLTDNERTATRRIASVRIHVERAIERIKNYQLLHIIPNSMHNSANQLFFVCAMLTNFLLPLVE